MKNLNRICQVTLLWKVFVGCLFIPLVLTLSGCKNVDKVYILFVHSERMALIKQEELLEDNSFLFSELKVKGKVGFVAAIEGEHALAESEKVRAEKYGFDTNVIAIQGPSHVVEFIEEVTKFSNKSELFAFVNKSRFEFVEKLKEEPQNLYFQQAIEILKEFNDNFFAESLDELLSALLGDFAVIIYQNFA